MRFMTVLMLMILSTDDFMLVPTASTGADEAYDVQEPDGFHCGLDQSTVSYHRQWNHFGWLK